MPLDQFDFFDEDYLARLRARHEPTCNHFCKYFYQSIQNMVRHRLRGGDVNDIVQDVFAAAFKQIDKGQPREPAKLPGYMAAIARHILSRSGKLTPSDVDVSTLPDLRKSVEALLIQHVDKRRIEFVMRRLLPRDRQALELEFFSDLDREAIAQIMGVTTERLRGILFHALQRFRREWDLAYGEAS